MVRETVTKLIASQLNVDADRLVDEARLVEDLGADSANLMVLIMDMEDAFQLEVEDSAITTLKTVGDIVTFIQQATGEQ